MADAYGNPGGVAAGELIESAWGNLIQQRVVRIFPNKAALDASPGPLSGQIAILLDSTSIYRRTASSGWLPATASALTSAAPTAANIFQIAWDTAVGTWPTGGPAIIFRIDGTPIVGMRADGTILHSLTGTSGTAKTFVIDHPVDPTRFLVHACTEGPTADVVYRGRATLSDGEVEVDLPEWFDELTEPGTVTVLLTPVSSPAVIAAEAPKAGAFTVRGEACEFWWQVTAERAGTSFDPEPLRDDVRVYGQGPYAWIEDDDA